MANTTITQLSQSLSLNGDEKLALDNLAGTFNTTLNSMSIFTDKFGSIYPLSSSVALGDRIKVRRGTSLYNIQPGSSIFRDAPTGSGDATSNQVVLGSDSRLTNSRTSLAHSHSIDDTYLLQSELDKRIRTSSIAVANGVASLDGFGKVPLSQIADKLLEQVLYIGTWNPVSNTPFLSDVLGINQASLVKGNYYVATAAGTVNFGSGNITFGIGDWAISNGVRWQKVNTDAINSVAGKSGSAVTLYVTDIIDAVSVNGSTMAENSTITVSMVPTSSLHIVNKAYVDGKFLPLAGGTMTGDIYVSSTNQVQFNATDRYIRGGTDSILFYKGSDINFRVYDTGIAFVRSDLRVGGDITAFYTSDRRLKDNIKTLENPIEKLKKISGVSFDWKPESGHTGKDVGVIAQELEEIIPEAVTTRDNGFKAVKYDRIIPLLIEAIKSLQSQVEELKNK